MCTRLCETCTTIATIQAHNLIFGEIHNIAIRTYTQLSASSLLYSLNYPMSQTLGNRHLRCSVSIGIIKPMNASRRDLNNHSQASWEGQQHRKTSRAHAAPCPKDTQMQPCV